MAARAGVAGLGAGAAGGLATTGAGLGEAGALDGAAGTGWGAGTDTTRAGGSGATGVATTGAGREWGPPIAQFLRDLVQARAEFRGCLEALLGILSQGARNKPVEFLGNLRIAQAQGLGFRVHDLARDEIRRHLKRVICRPPAHRASGLPRTHRT